ncbi:MAG: AMIN domain-containing protein [Cyanobacteria bacterium P01_D01_bin.105]
MAAQLSAWRYDSSSRSLTLTLPDAVVPDVSVTAPDQLLIELPDTQVGDIRGQSVNDGFVEQIALEQATPETVWMVVDFVPGTVLSATQQVTPIAAASERLQHWTMQPTVMASRRVVDAAVTDNANSAAGAAALAVETPSIGTAIAQADFPDLPVLEPAVPLNQPVSVPPIRATSVRVPDLETSVVEIPIQSNPVQLDEVPMVPDFNGSESGPIELNAMESSLSESAPSDATEPSVSLAPPFLGEIDTAISETRSTQSPASIAIDSDPTVDTVRVREAEVTPRLDGRSEASAEAGISEFEIPTGRGRATNTSRWPEPIPFGQPLP